MQSASEEKSYTLEDIKDEFFPNREFDIMQLGVEGEREHMQEMFHDLLKKHQPVVGSNKPSKHNE